MYLVRFCRNDNQPNEDYYYVDKASAQHHFSLFENDNSQLYTRIELCFWNLDNESTIQSKIFAEKHLSHS